MSILPDRNDQIAALYAELPAVTCQACGECCVCPTCTLSEFIYLVNHLSDGQIRSLLCSSPRIDWRYAGNLACPMQADRLCTVHPVRPGACRLFGIPALSDMQVDDLENCRFGTTTTDRTVDAAFIADWLDRLYQIEAPTYPLYIEPYFVKGFNIFCWLDIVFDERIAVSPFTDIRSEALRSTKLLRYAEFHSPKTDLYAKICKITELSALIDNADILGVSTLLASIRDDHPLTGTYFYDEANLFIDHIAGAADLHI